ncbi:MAG TPA: GNAT family N-acetyltransferase [Ureibacillus sp.]|nr:GNAT family N-acetyltransferase [Ureibacillus sp.]
MNFIIEDAQDFRELAHFLAQQNKQKSSHIGYCGLKEEEIFQTLNEDFFDENGNSHFLIARNEVGDVIAAVGVEEDGTSGEVWGPFNEESSIEVQHQLFHQLLTSHPHIQTFRFFINNENTKQSSYMDTINAAKTGEHLILIVNRDNFVGVNQFISTPFNQSDFKAFQQLHHELFPNTYYNAETIMSRLSKNCVLKVLKNELNKFQGYAYYEVDPEMGEASLEYIGISPNAQNRGLGTILLREVLTEIFTYSQISDIQLCVDNGNTKANHVYLNVGFQPKDILNSYVLKRD